MCAPRLLRKHSQTSYGHSSYLRASILQGKAGQCCWLHLVTWGRSRFTTLDIQVRAACALPTRNTQGRKPQPVTRHSAIRLPYGAIASRRHPTRPAPQPPTRDTHSRNTASSSDAPASRTACSPPPGHSAAAAAAAAYTSAAIFGDSHSTTM